MRETTQTRAQWEAKATEELDGRPLKSVWRRSADGIDLAPLYMREAAPKLPEHLRARTSAGAGHGRGWMSVQEYRHADPRAANAAARRDVELGAHGLRFIVDGELRAGRTADATVDGLVCDPEQALGELLEGIDPTRTKIWIDAGLQAPRWT